MRKEERTENTFPTSDDAQPTLTPTTSDSCEHPPEEVSPASVASRGRRVPRVTTPVSVAFHPPGMTTGPRTRAERCEIRVNSGPKGDCGRLKRNRRVSCDRSA
ncbi:hypothetical protein CEXT_413411 [Caerostris extrusa]|uniref:Uncharacterized protein n=1 Tax=Caerostris extrusa TaxID=172846 RepID=A0AAV4N0R2_CAEEX|nr:hypothetical protein CEXT_413411 [Caerostris extrusa]